MGAMPAVRRCWLLLPLLALIVTYAAASNVQLSLDQLAALDTSFSAKIAKASMLSSQQGAASGDATVRTAGWSSDSPDSVGVWWSTSNYITLGEWTQQLLEELEGEYAAQGDYGRNTGPQPDESQPKPDEQEGYSSQPGAEEQPDSKDQGSSGYEQPQQYSRKFAPYVPLNPRLPTKTEEVCLQELSRSSCQEDDTVTYQSSVGCCLASGEDGYHAEPRYPGYPSLPSYSPGSFREEEAARIIHNYNRGLPLDTEELEEVTAPTTTFWPDGSEPVAPAASCAWEVTLNSERKAVDDTTSVTGRAHGTCSFNSSLEYCSPLLCKGLTFSIQAVVYETDAVAKSSNTAVLDRSCQVVKLQPKAKGAVPLPDREAKMPQPATRSLKEAGVTDAHGRDAYARNADRRDAYSRDADEREANRRKAYEREAYEREAYEREAYAKYRRTKDYDANIIAGARPSGMSMGTAVVYAGVVSANGLKHDSKLKHGVIEHVASFTAKSLTVAEYEDLASNTPHIKPYGYKVVFLGDESSY